MKKKGFTLIELLAVIVILAVIALIATPAVLNIIEDSKKSAAEASARSIIEAAKTYYMQKIMEGETVSSIDLSGSTLTYDGDKATKGLLTYDANGNVSGKMYISGYCVEVASDGTVKSNKTDESECDVSGTNQGSSGSDDVTKIYENGTVVYYNPETNTKCSSSEAVSTTGTKTGCMKWYTFNDDESDTINLLLDHNTTATVAWASKDDYIADGGTSTNYGNNGNSDRGPLTALDKLQTDTSSWNKSINARLIEASEIAKVTGNTTWTTSSSYYYFHNNTQTQYTGTKGTNNFAWLFDNTAGCTTYGCNVADSGTSGYWTGTAHSGEKSAAWYVLNDGTLYARFVSAVDIPGVRPVITVNKSVLK